MSLFDVGRVQPIHRGNWSDSTEYKKMDIVFYNGSSYWAVEDNINEAPFENTDYWTLMGEKGEVGEVANIRYGVATGTNDYSISFNPPIQEYEAGLMINFLATNENTLAGVTLNINGLGTKPIYRKVDQELSSGMIKAGQIISVIYDGSAFQVISGSGSGGIALPLYENYTLTSDNNTVPFNIPNFDMTKDILFVYSNSVFLQVGVDYSLSNTEITKLSGNWDSGTEFNFVCFQMVDTDPDALGIASIESHFEATQNNTTNCLLETSNFNPQNDVLYVFFENLMLFEGIDYEVNSDMVSIDLLSFDLNDGDIIRYKILKKVRQNLTEYDGSLFQDGTISKPKLSAGLQQDLDDLESGLGSHLAESANPHNVTKDQIGLSQVRNVTSPQEIIRGFGSGSIISDVQLTIHTSFLLITGGNNDNTGMYIISNIGNNLFTIPIKESPSVIISTSNSVLNVTAAYSLTYSLIKLR